MSLYKEFHKNIRPELKKQLGKKNLEEVPEIDKVIVCMGIGSLSTRKGVKDFSDLEKNLITITGQKPQMIKSRQSISNFKLREDMPMMLKVTLRRSKAYDFLDRLGKLVLPRVRDFSGLSSKKFDGRGNYNIGFPNQVVFPELSPEEIVTPQGVQVNIATTADDDIQAQQLLESLGLIFQKK